MKFKTLMALAIAGAFATPLAFAQGTGGTTTAPSATHPQGNPPAAAPAGAQADEKTPDLAKDKRAKKDKDARSTDSGTGSTSGTTGSGAGNMGSGSTGSSGSTSSTSGNTPKSPSSGGPSSTQGSPSGAKNPVGAN